MAMFHIWHREDEGPEPTLEEQLAEKAKRALAGRFEDNRTARRGRK